MKITQTYISVGKSPIGSWALGVGEGWGKIGAWKKGAGGKNELEEIM